MNIAIVCLGGVSHSNIKNLYFCKICKIICFFFSFFKQKTESEFQVHIFLFINVLNKIAFF